MNVTLNSDWARSDMGGENIAGVQTGTLTRSTSRDSHAANVLLFKALSCGAELSQVMGQSQQAASWTQLSQKVECRSQPRSIFRRCMT